MIYTKVFYFHTYIYFIPRNFHVYMAPMRARELAFPIFLLALEGAPMTTQRFDARISQPLNERAAKLQDPFYGAYLQATVSLKMAFLVCVSSL